MTSPRYLTKSRFKLATQCPTKLFYTRKPQYPDTMIDDPFLAALADGGHQVGELAKRYHPDGHDIKSLSYDESERETLELLKQDKVTIFEPAIRFNNLFIRVDILIKHGNHFELIEVKAKSYTASEDKDFLNTKEMLDSKWKPYIYDVAFQKYVLQSAFPNAIISSYLMLVDKNAVCETDGMNQKFILFKDENNRKGIDVSSTLTEKDLNTKLLKKVNVDKAINIAYEHELTTGMPAHTFIHNINALSKHYAQDLKIAPVIGKKCKDCEFTCSHEDEQNGLLSGKKECWQEQLRWQASDFAEPTVLDVWNFRGAEHCIQDGIIKLNDMTIEDIDPESTIDGIKRAALSTKERQWLQIEKTQKQDTTLYFDDESMAREFASWTYPLHFIDFETSAVAIPFYKGMRPYEGIAFQFSHHQVNEDGSIAHAGQFLNTEKGQFPNFEFIRALQDELGNDNGTILMYSPHENTFLNTIYRQLQQSNEHDKDSLCEFIKTITVSRKKSDESWSGERAMVDMLKLVKQYCYDPATNGSNSIKYVLPAMLNSSTFLQNKYSQPVYGSSEMPSLNFTYKRWIQFDDNGHVIDPYKQLPKMFSDATDHDVELLSEGDELNNGGLALTAYAKMQFTEMSEYERAQLSNALLMYCELDTWAMVAIYEGWKEMLISG